MHIAGRFCVEMKKAANRFYAERRLSAIRFFKTSCANVSGHFFAVFHVRNLLYVSLKGSSGFTVGVAYVVAGCLTFPADIANSRHIDTSE